jgi:hypothetical protein
MGQQKGSNSSSSQATSETNQQVAAQGGGGSGDTVSIGSGASYVNEFSPDVAQAVNSAINGVFNFAGNVVNAMGQTTSTIAQNSNAAIGAVTNAAQNASNVSSEALNNSQLGQTSILTNPVVIFGIVGVLGIFAYIITKRKG